MKPLHYRIIFLLFLSMLSPTALSQTWTEINCEDGSGWRECSEGSSCQFKGNITNIWLNGNPTPQPPDAQYFVVMGLGAGMTNSSRNIWGTSMQNHYGYAHPKVGLNDGGAVIAGGFNSGTYLPLNDASIPYTNMPWGIPGHSIDFIYPVVQSSNQYVQALYGDYMVYKNYEDLPLQINGINFRVGKLMYHAWSHEWPMAGRAHYELCEV